MLATQWRRDHKGLKWERGGRCGNGPIGDDGALTKVVVGAGEKCWVNRIC